MVTFAISDDLDENATQCGISPGSALFAKTASKTEKGHKRPFIFLINNSTGYIYPIGSS